VTDKHWKVLASRQLFDRPWLKIRVDQVRTGRGVTIDEYHLIQALDWVCVVCVTEAQELVLVEQYRHGVGQVTLELPAGAVDGGETPLQAAQRELREETGYAAKNWTHLLSVSPETTRHSHRAHLFLATEAILVGSQQLEQTEDVAVRLWPQARDTALITQLSHGIHVTAWLLAQARLAEVGSAT
jgi:8-oxo-dGTP pyrophosphatase MutT (NUDIX family)